MTPGTEESEEEESPPSMRGVGGEEGLNLCWRSYFKTSDDLSEVR